MSVKKSVGSWPDSDALKAEISILKEKTGELVRKHPEKAVKILEAWVNSMSKQAPKTRRKAG